MFTSIRRLYNSIGVHLHSLYYSKVYGPLSLHPFTPVLPSGLTPVSLTNGLLLSIDSITSKCFYTVALYNTEGAIYYSLSLYNGSPRCPLYLGSFLVPLSPRSLEESLYPARVALTMLSDYTSGVTPSYIEYNILLGVDSNTNSSIYFS